MSKDWSPYAPSEPLTVPSPLTDLEYCATTRVAPVNVGVFRGVARANGGLGPSLRAGPNRRWLRRPLPYSCEFESSPPLAQAVPVSDVEIASPVPGLTEVLDVKGELSPTRNQPNRRRWP